MNDILMELLFTHKADFERIPDELIPVVRRIVDAALAAQRERLKKEVQLVRADYPDDVSPGDTGKVARLICDRVLALLA